jgi:hypothetical protein
VPDVQTLARLYLPGQFKITEIRPLPEGAQIASSELGQIAIGDTLRVQPSPIGKFVGATTIAPEHSLNWKNVLTSGGCVTAAGAVAFHADKVAAMPVADLAHLLQQTPQFHVTPQLATATALNLKDVANSVAGHFIIVGASGGLLAVGIARWFRPQASFKELLVWFLGGAAVLIGVIWLLFELGLVSPTTPTTP